KAPLEREAVQVQLRAHVPVAQHWPASQASEERIDARALHCPPLLQKYFPAAARYAFATMGWWSGRRVTITGGRGFLGRRLVELLQPLKPAEIFSFPSQQFDPTRQADVARMYAGHRPDVVIHMADRAGWMGA